MHNNYKHAWETLLIKTNEIQYHITITFNQSINDKAAHQALRHLIHIFNTKLFGRNYNKRNMALTGFAIRERGSDQSIHFHLLINKHADISGNEKDYFQKLLHTSIKRVRNVDSSNQIGKHQSIYKEGIRIDTVYNDNIAGYLTKSLKGIDSDFIGIINNGQIIFGNE